MNDLFSAAGVSAPISAPIAEEMPPATPPDPEEVLLATPADQTVFNNLPPFADGYEAEAFIFAHIVLPDASGPVASLTGTTLERWGNIKRLLAFAWRGTPRRQRPAIITMPLPRIDRDRRRRIAKLAGMPGVGR